MNNSKQDKLRIGIDASNIRAGGGMTHLSEFLKAVDPEKHKIGQIIVWGGEKTLSRLPTKSWLELEHIPQLDGGAMQRAYWQNRTLDEVAEQSCDLLYIPGGTYLGKYRPYVTHLQNMLPFEFTERKRYGYTSKTFWRLTLLHFLQKYTFSQANGVIYVSEYSRKIVRSFLDSTLASSSVIYHGIDSRFFSEPRQQFPITDYSFEKPFRFLYVSIVDVYKHQWYVAEAVSQLRAQGLPITIDFVGPSYTPSLKKLQNIINAHDPSRKFLHYRGVVPYAELHEHYKSADGFVFASSCESISNIVMEAMASGLPIACARKGAMPEVLGKAGIYFDPENPREIAEQLKSMLLDTEGRIQLAKDGYKRAQAFSWNRCADETCAFLSRIAKGE